MTCKFPSSRHSFYNGCQRKRAFSTKAEARDAVAKRIKKLKRNHKWLCEQLHEYRCNFCGMWHIGKRGTKFRRNRGGAG